MRSLTALFFFSLLSNHCLAQKQDLVDSVGAKICESITLSKEPDDSTRLFDAFRTHLMALPSRYSDEQKDSIGDRIYFRLQKSCIVFKQLLERHAPKNEYWSSVEIKPASKISKADYEEFKKNKKFHYFEPDGGKVNLDIDNGLWTDHFADGSYSKLKLYWGADRFFDIEFIESNNDIRMKFSNPGDKYRYTIIEKAAGYYVLCAEVVGVKRYSIFKLYLQ